MCLVINVVPVASFRSVCLLLQAALPCLLFAPKSSKVTLKGGTNADMAPPIDYAIKVLFKLFCQAEFQLIPCRYFSRSQRGLECSLTAELLDGRLIHTYIDTCVLALIVRRWR